MSYILLITVEIKGRVAVYKTMIDQCIGLSFENIRFYFNFNSNIKIFFKSMKIKKQQQQ